MPNISLAGQEFTYSVIKKRIKNINLRLISQNEIRVAAPFGIPQIFIEKFITDNQLWILVHASKLSQRLDLTQLTQILILGEMYQVFIIKSLRDKITFNHSSRQIIIKTRLLSHTHLKLIIPKFFKPLAEKLIIKEIKYFQNQFHFQYGHVSLRTQKTRYGSCSSAGNLSFNWQIILFPYDKFQHVILHELAHLTHHNHSPRFWYLLGEYDPHSRTNRQWIRKDANKSLLI